MSTKLEEAARQAEELAGLWRSADPEKWGAVVESARQLFIPYLERGQLKMFVPAEADPEELRLFIAGLQHVANVLVSGRCVSGPTLVGQLVKLLVPEAGRLRDRQQLQRRLRICFLILSLVKGKVFNAGWPAAFSEILREKTDGSSA